MELRQDKRGMILVFALIIVSVLLSTALSFSYFIITDINKARAIDDSVIAYYAADAGIEESLYSLKKQEVTESLVELVKMQSDGILTESNGAWDISDSTDSESGFLRQRLFSGQSAKFFILNRASSNSTKSVSLEWFKGKDIEGESTVPQLQVNLTQLAPQNENGSLVYYTEASEVEVADSSSLSGVKCYDLNNSDIDGIPQSNLVDYMVEFKVLGSSKDDYVDRLMASAYAKHCSDDKWSESINISGITNLTLRSRGSYGRSQQNIIAHILPKDTISGILSFVLFSEQDITKDQ
jgi:hypothetical protein